MEAKSLFIETDEVVLHAMDWGNNGPLLIVMHGGQRTSRSWDEVARGLSKDHWVITLDSRGQGESSAPTRGYSQIDRVRDLYKFCDALGLPPAFAFALSFAPSFSFSFSLLSHRSQDFIFCNCAFLFLLFPLLDLLLLLAIRGQAQIHCGLA